MEREKTGTTDLTNIAGHLPVKQVRNLKFEIRKILVEFAYTYDDNAAEENMDHIDVSIYPDVVALVKEKIYGRTELSGHKEITNGR